MLAPLAQQKELALRVDGRRAEAPVDPPLIRQALLNLVSNAIQFSPPGGEIDVTVQPDGDRIVVEVRDTGIGISAENVSKIWNRFYQVDQARTSNDRGGAGLGLSLVAEVVARHAGEVRMESELGVGTTAGFIIPLPGCP